MKTDKRETKGLNRRDFIKTTAVGVGSVALAGIRPKTASPAGVPEKWDEEADVVIIGLGGAGTAAAIEAHDAGARVLVLEKMPGWGGNTAVSGGAFLTPKTPLNLDIVEYLLACGKGRVDRETATAWAEEAVHLGEWFTKHLGGKLISTPGHGGYHPYKGGDQILYWLFPGSGLQAGSGQGLFKILSDALKARKIPYKLETPVKELVTTDKGDVIGVIAENQGKKLTVKARRGVILACGGFDYNDWLKLHNLRVSPTYGTGSPGNTGDAITMAGKLGAKLWKMNELNGCLCYKFPESEIAWSTALHLLPTFFAAPTSVIIVNRHARRFANETLTYDAFHKALCPFDISRDEYPNVPSYTIFDETTRKSGPLGYGRGWSQDNQKEIKKGWILQADTIRELAGKAGLDPVVLEKTVKQYNTYCASGKDPEFGRKMLKPLQTLPYYAIKGYPGSYGTMGGPKINPKAQVVDVCDRVITRLYAAGNASSGAWGFHYNGGGGNSDAFTFGRIAGRNAAAEAVL
jgi:succinate dehydrogenase/fumarate reductase flavoprotein subunit